MDSASFISVQFLYLYNFTKMNMQMLIDVDDMVEPEVRYIYLKSTKHALNICGTAICNRIMRRKMIFGQNIQQAFGEADKKRDQMKKLKKTYRGKLYKAEFEEDFDGQIAEMPKASWKPHLEHP